MSIDNFVPVIWAASLLTNLNRNHVFKNVFNDDYEGEISAAGDTVKINSIGRITISDYTKNTDLAAPQILQDAALDLKIDQAKSYHFYVDDLDKRQAKVNWREGAMTEAAFGLADATDTFLAAALAAGLPAANTLTAATVGTGPNDSDAYSLIVDLGVLLDDNNVPSDGRCVFVPNWYEGMLRKDPRFTSFGTDANVKRLRGDPIGQIDQFEVYKSNNMPLSGGQPIVLASYKGAATFAEQISEVVAYKPERRFGDAQKGLHLYGAKITRPNAIAGVVATKGS